MCPEMPWVEVGHFLFYFFSRVRMCLPADVSQGFRMTGASHRPDGTKV